MGRFIRTGEVYVGDGGRRVRVSACYYPDNRRDKDSLMVKVHFLDGEGGFESIPASEFDAEFELE